ncbi:MAG: xanthine dehydrogenase family protein subunit M [Burkholderiaceae bacterium]
MQAFQFQQPKTVADAVQAFGGGPEIKYLAGGQSLLPSMRLGLASPETLIDLDRVDELKGITRDGDRITIGAMTRHAEIAASADVKTLVPALAHMAEMIGDRQVRNRGTLGGSLANNDPAACYPAAVLALDASLKTNRRTIEAKDFFKGLYETALEPDELLVSVTFSKPEKSAYYKFRQQASHFALVGVFVAKTVNGVRVAVTGAAPVVFRMKALEDKLAANWAPESCDGVTMSADGLNSDLHATAEYRAHLIPVLTKRAVAEAV